MYLSIYLYKPQILRFGAHSAAICGLSLLLVLCAPKGFSPVTPVFPGPHFQIPISVWNVLVWYFLIFPLNTWSEGNQKVDCPFKLFVCFCFFIFWQIILLTRMTNERLRCITNIEYFTDITNIPQQIMLVFAGNNLGITIWIKTFFKLKCGFNFIFSRYSVAWYCRQIFFPWRKLANYMTSFALC